MTRKREVRNISVILISLEAEPALNPAYEKLEVVRNWFTMQTVFKIDMPKGPECGEEKPFIPRRVHKKSRGGCIACKKRRIKVRSIQIRLPFLSPSYSELMRQTV